HKIHAMSKFSIRLLMANDRQHSSLRDDNSLLAMQRTGNVLTRWRQGGMAMRRQVLMMVAVGVTAIALASNTPARAGNEAEVAEDLIELGNNGRGGGRGY